MLRINGTLSLLVLLSLCPRPSHAAALVQDGKAVAVVALPPSPDEAEALAAKELIDHVEKMSGVTLPTVTVDPAAVDAFLEKSRKEGQAPVVLGRAAWPKLEAALKAKGTTPGTFVLRASKDAVLIAGTDHGTAFGVSELLEQQGVRWFMPGDLGTVIPEKKTVVVAEQETAQAPGFASRWFQMPDKDWQVRVRCGGPVFPGAHGLPGLPKFAAAPELYSLVGGKRTARQHCLSNPKVLDLVVAEVLARRKKGLGPTIGMGPNDGRGFCECDECRKLDGGDFDPFSGEPSVTDRYVWFFNKVLERVDGQYPDTRLAFYIYHSYMRPPVRWKPDPRITGALAPIALDRVHGFSNPVAPEKSYAKWLYQEWGKLIPDLYDRGYWSNLSDPGVPFVIVHRLRDEIPACHALGVKGWRVETFPNYGPTLPSNYVAAKLMWDPKADVDALLADFAEKFFGPAAAPMGRYVTLMDAALRDSPYITGSAWDTPHHYPPAVRKQAKGLLDDAAMLAAGKGAYEARVRMVAETFEMLEAFVGMLEARARCDFEAAQKELNRLDAVAEKLMAYKPVPMLSAGRFSTYVNYMKRFFRPATEQAYKRVTGGNRLAAAAADEWDFLIDPPRVGESIGLFRPESRGGNWQRIKSSSSSWSNQGLRYYKGLAWYRQTVDVPADFAGKRLFLWCGGVDEKAKVWVNGKLVGISPGAAFSPFEMDATDAVRPGKPNVIVFEVNNEVVNELGTGGIVAPVILYVPAAGKDAVPENVRPLGETFP
ncbi:MAG TPA: DUF4838 domain-containing protein [Humisphaera sp.]